MRIRSLDRPWGINDDILVIFIDFYGVSHGFLQIFFATRIRISIIDTDPELGGKNDADPDPQH